MRRFGSPPDQPRGERFEPEMHAEGECDHCGEWHSSLKKTRNGDDWLCLGCRGWD